MRNLIIKEFRLNINPFSYAWLLMGALLLIPTWPFFIAVGYCFFFFMLITQIDKANQDLAFALSLPVPKSRIVLARALTMVIVEAAMLVLCAPFAIARYYIYPDGNTIGMNTNLAFFALMLVMFAVFNAIFLPGAYKAAYRILWPMLGGSVIAAVVGGGLTTLVPFQPWLAARFNDRGLGEPGWQLGLFLVGVLVFAASWFLSYRKAVANFGKVDL